MKKEDKVILLAFVSVFSLSAVLASSFFLAYVIQSIMPIMTITCLLIVIGVFIAKKLNAYALNSI
jgi:hypothetical protein